MIVWNDIEHLTKNYTNGIKKLDGLNENQKCNNNKTNHNKNKFHLIIQMMILDRRKNYNKTFSY